MALQKQEMSQNQGECTFMSVCKCVHFKGIMTLPLGHKPLFRGLLCRASQEVCTSLDDQHSIRDGMPVCDRRRDAAQKALNLGMFAKGCTRHERLGPHVLFQKRQSSTCSLFVQRGTIMYKEAKKL